MQSSGLALWLLIAPPITGRTTLTSSSARESQAVRQTARQVFGSDTMRDRVDLLIRIACILGLGNERGSNTDVKLPVDQARQPNNAIK